MGSWQNIGGLLKSMLLSLAKIEISFSTARQGNAVQDM